MKSKTRKGQEQHQEDSAQNGSITSVNLAEETVTKPVKEPWIKLLFIFPMYCLMGINFIFYPMCYVELVRYFRVPTAQVGWPTSIHQAVTLLFGIFLTTPVKMYGGRVVSMVGGLVLTLGTGLCFFADGIIALSVSYGLVAGIGVSMLMLASMILLQQSFQKNRSVATSISMCGLSVGNALGPMWVKYLLDTFGWRGGFLLHSGLMLQTTVLATQYRSQRSTRQASEKEEHRSNICNILKDSLDFSLLKECTFLLYGISVFFLRMMGDGTMTVLANSVVFHGGTRQQAATIVTVMFSSFLVSRLISGFVAKLSCVNTVIMLGVSTFVGGCFMILLAMVRGFIPSIPFISVYGACVGCSNMLIYVALVNVSGIDNIARSTALVFAFQGVAALFGPPFSGLWFDLTGNYIATFLVNGGFGVFGGLLVVLVYIMMRRQRYKQQKLPIDDETYVPKAEEESVV